MSIKRLIKVLSRKERKLSNVHILWKNVSWQVFLTNRSISETFRQNYKPWRS